MRLRRRHPAAALLGTVTAVSLVMATGAGEIVGGGVATACAQVPTDPTQMVPTLGPIDPACSRVPDTDNDDVFDYQDNCNGYFNPSQKDTDKDSGPPPYEPVDTKTNPRDPATGGDTCDTEDDGDGIPDVDDNCQKVPNKDQADGDGDGIGDLCDDENNRVAVAPPTVESTAGAASPQQPSGAAAPSWSRPALSVQRLPRTLRIDEVRAGIAVPVRCSAACTVSGELVDARRRRLAQGAARTDEAGLTFVFLRLSSKTLSRVARARTTKATVRLTASDPAGGNRSATTRRVTLRR